MANYFDSERLFYMSQLAVTSGNLFDLAKQFYISELASTDVAASTLPENTRDLELTWLKSKVAATENIYDGWNNFLKSEGYSGNLEDMKQEWYEDNI